MSVIEANFSDEAEADADAFDHRLPLVLLRRTPPRTRDGNACAWAKAFDRFDSRNRRDPADHQGCRSCDRRIRRSIHPQPEPARPLPEPA